MFQLVVQSVTTNSTILKVGRVETQFLRSVFSFVVWSVWKRIFVIWFHWLFGDIKKISLLWKLFELHWLKKNLFQLAPLYLGQQLHGAIYHPDSYLLMVRYCANLKAIRYESTSLNRIVADKSHRVIVSLLLNATSKNDNIRVNNLSHIFKISCQRKPIFMSWTGLDMSSGLGAWTPGSREGWSRLGLGFCRYSVYQGHLDKCLTWSDTWLRSFTIRYVLKKVLRFFVYNTQEKIQSPFSHWITAKQYVPFQLSPFFCFMALMTHVLELNTPSFVVRLKRE